MVSVCVNKFRATVVIFRDRKRKRPFHCCPGLPISGRDAPTTDFCPEKQPRREHYWITRAN